MRSLKEKHDLFFKHFPKGTRLVRKDVVEIGIARTTASKFLRKHVEQGYIKLIRHGQNHVEYVVLTIPMKPLKTEYSRSKTSELAETAQGRELLSRAWV